MAYDSGRKKERRSMIVGAAKRLKESDFCAENILGMISPKSRSTKVRIIVSMMNSTMGDAK